MYCPACHYPMTETTVSDVKMDICEGGCGGIWFDTYEFRKFDEPHEYAGDQVLFTPRDPKRHIDKEDKHICPRCTGVIMMRHFFSVKRTVELDECASCGGIFLDAGELAALRDLYRTEEERRQHAEEVFDEMFGPELTERLVSSQEKLARKKRVSHMLRFICPSYYLPDDQDWGAF